MVQIQQREAKKCPGKFSLWVSFNYNQKLVDILKSIEGSYYYERTKEWEVHFSKLSELIDTITYIDDITLQIEKDKTVEHIVPKLTHKINPFKHQQEGIEWMLNHKNGLLLDCPGLGKTLTTIYTAEELKAQRGIEHCLVICGVNTLKQNWKKEIEKCSTESCRIIGEKINKNGIVKYSKIKDRAKELYENIDEFFVILNVESLRDSLVLDAIQNSSNNFDMVVFDEVHVTKDPNTLQGKGILRLSTIGEYHYGLTGTLLINSPIDCYVPLKFIKEEKACFSNFKNFYCIITKNFGHFQIDGFKNIETLKEELDSCSLRRTKDILDLPPKIIIPEYIEMEEAQSKFYKDIYSGVVEEADRVNIKTTSLLGLVIRLIEASSCPQMLSTNSKINSCKIDRAVELIQEITSNNEKVIVFSSFKEPLYYLADRIKEYNPLICTGDQDDVFISSAIDQFQNDNIHQVILCTPSKMGTGVTLNRATYEIFLNSSWTYALEEQTEDRAHRITNTKALTIYKLIAKDTIDERIQKVLRQKKSMSDYLIDGEVTSSAEELRELLGISLT